MATKIRESILQDQPELCPELDHELRKRLGMNARMGSQKVERLWEKCKDDPEFYIFGGFIRTFDEKARKIREFPTDKPLKKFINHIFSGGVGDVNATSKSRQQQFSWCLAAAASYEARFHPYARVLYQGKKGDDSEAFVFRNSFLHSRVGFIERALPLFLRSTGLKGTLGHLWYQGGAEIMALARGVDQARSWSASFYIFDEAAYIENFELTYGGVLPIIKGDPANPESGGRICIISTAEGSSDFAKIIEKTPDWNYHEDDRTPVGKGMWEYTTTDRVRVFECYYPAFAAKDPDTPEGQAWRNSAVVGMRGGFGGNMWQQEYEGNYRIVSGRRVWVDFDTSWVPHITYDPDIVDIGEHWPIYAGMDWGIVNPTVFTFHAFESLERAYQFDEIYVTDKTPHDIAKILKSKWYFPHIKAILGDPMIWRRTPKKDESSMTSVGEMFASEGIQIGKGRNDNGSDMVYLALLQNNLWANRENPKWMVSRRCVHTINSYRNLRLQPNTNRKDLKDDPEKILDKNVDPFDANKYCFLSIGYESPEDMAAPFGSFQYEWDRMEERMNVESWLG